MGYNRRELLIATLLVLGNIAQGLCYSIQAPLFPPEAEKKGVNPTQYGFVFGIYELISAVMSLVLGKISSEIGVKFMTIWSLVISGGSCVLFGFLDQMPSKTSFLTFAYLIRVVEGLGTAGFFTASYCLIAKEFSEKAGRVFALTEASFGFGLIFGPFIGSTIYSISGYRLPFVLLGSIILAIGFVIILYMPKINEDVEMTSGSFKSIMKIKSIMLIMMAVAFSTYAFGCIQVGMEPMLRSYHQLTPFQIGIIFVICGVSYAIATLLWGPISDKYASANTVIILSSILVTISFLILAPAPFIPTHSVPMTCVALVLQGIGMGGHLVGGYVGAKNQALLHGLPDDVNTYGIVSGIFNFSIGLGAFLGPSLSGYLIDLVGYPWTTQVVVLMQLFIIVSFIMNRYCFRDSSSQSEERTLLRSSFSKENPIIPNGENIVY